MFVLAAKDFEKVLTKAIDVVGMGSKTTAATVTLMFKKTGVTLGVTNQAGAYTADLVCKVDGYKKCAPVSVIPDVLLSYVKGRKTIKIEPKQDGLAVVGSGGLNAKLYYVGDGLAVEPVTAGEGEGMQIHAVGLELLKSIESMKDRTEKKPLSGQLVWSKKDQTIEIIAGDTHHAAHIKRDKIKCKSSGKITLPFVSLKRILNVGGNIYIENNSAYAIAETETILLNNMVESEAISLEDMNELYANDSKASVTFKSAELAAAIDTLSIGIEESTPITMSIDAENKTMTCSVKTGAARGSIKIKLEKVKKSVEIKVLALHLFDCMKCIKSASLKMELRQNLAFLEGIGDTDHVRCVVTLVSD